MREDINNTTSQISESRVRRAKSRAVGLIEEREQEAASGMNSAQKSAKQSSLKKMLLRCRRMIELGYDQFLDPYYQGVSAQLAFFMFLSILPTIILLSQVLGIFSLSLSNLEDWLDVNITGAGLDTIKGMLDYSPSGINSIFLAITALWAASRVQFAMIRVTNYTLTDGLSTGQGYVKDRLRSLQTILITIFTVAFSLIVVVYGPTILDLVLGKFLGRKVSYAAWMALRWPLAAALYFLMISYNYYVLPSIRVRYRDIVPGSIFASVGFLVVTIGYNIYISFSANYDILYGSFSNIVVLMFWFWFISWVMCLGVTFNRMWWATRPEDPIPIAPEAYERRKPINIV